QPNNTIMNKQNRKDAVNWFELYVADFDRAKKFYETVLQSPLQEFNSGTCRMGMFAYDNKHGVGGAITKMEGTAPGGGGP
ncbi:MAG: hypothetical protein AB1705_28370, partial [Verrucomicrobiota bacterium]